MGVAIMWCKRGTQDSIVRAGLQRICQIVWKPPESYNRFCLRLSRATRAAFLAAALQYEQITQLFMTPPSLRAQTQSALVELFVQPSISQLALTPQHQH